MRPKVVAMVVIPLLLCGIGLPAAAVFAVVGFFATNASQAAEEARGCTGVGQDVVVSGQGGVRLPVVGSFVYTSAFGFRFHPVLGYSRPHNGADMVSLPGPGTVVAAKSGKVDSRIMGDPGAGNYVVIDHGGGLKTRYFHLASIDVQDGESVGAGTKIGTEGATGTATGVHLHFEVLQGGTPIDPVVWLSKNGVKMPALEAAGTAPAAGVGGTDAKGEAKKDEDVEVVTANPVPRANRNKVDKPSVDASKGLAGFTPEQTRVAADIVRAANDKSLDEWTATVGVMTAIGESTLAELDYGDSAGPDSRGPFQQRTSWGSEAQRMDAYSSALLFFEALVKVAGYRQMAPTMAAHAVQRNADANHYAQHWARAVELTSQLVDNPDLVASLGGSDGASADCDITAITDKAPAAKPGDCPETGMPGEAGLQPGALRGMRCTKELFPWITEIYGVGERTGASDHPNGLATDFMVPNYRTEAGRENGWKVANWVRKNAKDLKVTYIIFDKKIWNIARAGEGWREYSRYAPTASDTELHLDHVHVSYSS